MAERRREQAAEEARSGPAKVYCLAWITLVWSLPLNGNVLYKPLDSPAACSRRGSANCILKACFRRNDNGGNYPACLLPRAGIPAPAHKRQS